MPMGTKSSAAIFQRAMDQVLAPFSNTNRFRVRHVQAQARDEPGAGELEVTPASMGSVRTDAEGGVQREERTGWAFGTAFAYVDDVLVCSMGTREEHVALVDAVMASFAKFDFTFKLSKTELYKSELDFLGHRLTQQGLTRQEAKVDAIRKWAAPTTQSELRSFISVIGYYRRFVEGFARIAQPLTDMLREGQFVSPLPPAAQKAFVELRERLSQAPILKFFDPRDETELWTDASATAIGGAAMQRDARGNLRPVAYYSRRLSPSEEKYSTYQRELLGIRDCLLAFRRGPAVRVQDGSLLATVADNGLDARSDVELPSPCELFPSGALVQPAAPPDCPIFQTWEQRPWSVAPSSTSSCTLADWQARGYNVSIVTPSFLASFGPAYLECTEFGPVWRALSQGAAGHDMYPDFFSRSGRFIAFPLRWQGGGYGGCIPRVCSNAGDTTRGFEGDARRTDIRALWSRQDVYPACAAFLLEVDAIRRGGVRLLVFHVPGQQGIHGSAARHTNPARGARRKMAGRGVGLGVVGYLGGGLRCSGGVHGHVH